MALRGQKTPRLHAGPLALVKTPFQAVAATEFAYEEAWVGEATLILMPSSAVEVSLRQMQNVADRYPWRAVVTFPQAHVSFKQRAKRGALVMRSLLTHSSIDTLIVGDMTSSFAPYLSLLPHERVVLLDDGLKTLRFEEVAREFREGFNRRSSLRRWAIGRYDFLNPRRELLLFSAVNDLPSCVTARRNRFRWLAQQLCRLPAVKETWLVGQPLVDLGVLGDEDYVAAFGRVIGEPNRLVRYFPHRLEKAETASACARKLGASLELRNAPLELEPLARSAVPNKVVGISSTALLSLRRVLPIQTSVEVSVLSEDAFRDTVHSQKVLRAQTYLVSQLVRP